MREEGIQVPGTGSETVLLHGGMESGEASNTQYLTSVILGPGQQEAKGLWCQEEPGLHHAIPQIDMKTYPVLAPIPSLLFPVPLSQSSIQGQDKLCVGPCHDVESQGPAGPKRWRKIVTLGNQGLQN